MNRAETVQNTRGAVLRQARRTARISPQHLAERMGCSRSTLWRYETGRQELGADAYESAIAALAQLMVSRRAA